MEITVLGLGIRIWSLELQEMLIMSPSPCSFRNVHEMLEGVFKPPASPGTKGDQHPFSNPKNAQNVPIKPQYMPILHPYKPSGFYIICPSCPKYYHHFLSYMGSSQN